MHVKTLAKLGGALLLTAGLAACMDMKVDIAVLSETTGTSTVTQIMDKSTYDLIASGEEGAASFCEGGNVVTEGETVTCTIITEGTFEELNLGEDGSEPAITVVGPGLVRVALPTSEITKGFEEGTGGEELDAETKAMMTAFFEGHTITFAISGKEVVESNMTVNAGKTSAELVIPFLDLLNGTATLPPEAYAVVRVN